MVKRLWHYLINTFLVSTRSSYKKALDLGLDHEARLKHNQTDPVIAAMVASFGPVLQAYLTSDQNLDAALGDYKGDTLSVKQLFKVMNSTKLSHWEGQVHAQFPKGSPEELQFFPRSRRPFQESTYAQRIQAVKVFGDKCAALPSLHALGINVLAFHTQLLSARALQQTDGKAKVVTLRSLRESARVVMCVEMYGNLGLLMHHFRNDPKQVERFYDLTLLRTTMASGPQDTLLTFFLKNNSTGMAIAGGTGVLTLPWGETQTVVSNLNGKVQFRLGGLKAEVQVALLFSAPGFMDRNETGPITPGEDVDADIELMPIAPPPPTPPTS